MAKTKNTSHPLEDLTCTSVHRLAWNHEEVVLENADLKATLQIKNPELHQNFKKDKSYKSIFSNDSTSQLEKQLDDSLSELEAVKKALAEAHAELEQLKKPA